MEGNIPDPSYLTLNLRLRHRRRIELILNVLMLFQLLNRVLTSSMLFRKGNLNNRLFHRPIRGLVRPNYRREVDASKKKFRKRGLFRRLV